MDPQSLLNVAPPEFVHHIILAGKIAGSIVVIGGLVIGFVKWLSAVIRKITDINEHIKTVVTESLPLMQASLDAHGSALSGVKFDVRNVTTQLEETKASVLSVGISVADHIRTSDQERKEIQIDLAKKSVEIAALVAAEKVQETARQTAVLFAARKKGGRHPRVS